MTSMPYSSSIPRVFQWQIDFPGDATWTKISQVYQNALQPAYQELFVSSARIIQEHALRGWMDTSQACFNALLQNAAQIQQRAAGDLLAANQKAATIFAKDATDAVISNVTVH